MTTLAEIQTAVAALSLEQKYALYDYLAKQLEAPVETSTPSPHSVLDIAPVHLGPVLPPLNGDHDLLGEMLQQRM